MSDQAKVGVVGLGIIGSGAARAIAKAGFAVAGYDVDPAAAEQLAGVATAAASPAAAADGADVVLVAVFSDAQAREVLAGDGGILTAAAPPAVVVVLSTVSLETVRWATERCAERDVAFVDCGVTGGAQSLAEGSIVAMVGGSEAGVEAARPVLDAFASPVVHMGAPGNGMRAKLARNMIIYSERTAVWEAARLAHAAGVDVDRFLDVVRAGDHWSSHLASLDKGIGWPEPRDVPQEAKERIAGYAHKDLGAALELAEELGVMLPMATLTDRMFDSVSGLAPPPAE